MKNRPAEYSTLYGSALSPGLLTLPIIFLASLLVALMADTIDRRERKRREPKGG